MKCDAVVGYGWCRATYVALRSLHRMGLRVAVADEYKAGMALWSRFATATFTHPDYRNHPDAFVDGILDILERTGAKFYLPGHDEGEIVAAQRDRFPRDVVIPLHTYDMLVLANNKSRSMETARELGIPIPESVAYTGPEDLRGSLDAADRDRVVKLLRGTSAKGVFYARSSDETVAIVRRLIDGYRLEPDRYPIVQERVDGEGWGVSCLYWHGRRIASFTHRRLREKIVSGGTSTLRESAHNPVLEDHAHCLLDRLRWHGLAMVEFKWNPEREKAWFVEINPRLWGSIALPVACGVDFPALTYIAATRGPDEARKESGPYRDGVVARWYLGDVIRGVSRLIQFHPIDALACVMPRRADAYDDLPVDDPGALLGQYAFYLLRFLSSRSINPTDDSLIG